ncbi:hypothetical protein BKH41_08790 [Helicobacter sp. 12S02232-10]|uniref:hypothetical protein n=1 Tax=Helicobacter sp. 12S02232-10 TaxID=1476197 RepID=UPI000BA500F3|nr:hypothetical protein [Helicobacter sp. 12S02232-10]PAF46591.1 hypothetical protein BKH41_08790 [Helicobacter sp. 12S02232-10]
MTKAQNLANELIARYDNLPIEELKECFNKKTLFDFAVEEIDKKIMVAFLVMNDLTEELDLTYGELEYTKRCLKDCKAER